jgi:hypothetical protein
MQLNQTQQVVTVVVLMDVVESVHLVVQTLVRELALVGVKVIAKEVVSVHVLVVVEGTLTN